MTPIDMIDRVVVVLEKFANEIVRLESGNGSIEHVDREIFARKILTDMREPTLHMAMEGRDATLEEGYNDNVWISDSTAAEVWQLMIDAALAEGQ